MVDDAGPAEAGPADAAPPPPPSSSPLAPPWRPTRRPLRPSDLDALDFIVDVFLPEARARGLAVPSVPEVRPLLDELAGEARQGATPRGSGAWTTLPPQAYPTDPRGYPVRPQSYPNGPAGYPVGPQTARSPRQQPPASLAPHAPQGPVAARTASAAGQGWSPPHAPRPTPVRDGWQRLCGTVGSDLGVHGLAYLGVLLLFVGVFGLVAFAFGEVTPSLRPVAELAVAVVPFLGARLLIGNGAAVVGRALEVVGGLLLPIMAVTSQVDGYAVPPNPTGNGLVVGLTAACVVCAVAFAAWARRHPDSGLRFAAAPAVWLAAAMVTIGVGRPMPTGQDVAVPSSHQGAAMAVALAATILLARRRPGGRLAEATRAAAVPGIVVVALLAVLSWSADGTRALPVALTGVALLVALELLRARVPEPLADAVGPLWLGVVALVLGSVPGVDPHPAASGAVVGFVVLVELAARRGAPGWAVTLPLTGLGIALLTQWPASWWTVGTLAGVTGWAVVRRSRPVAGTAGALDAASALLPLGLAVAVGCVTSVGWGVAVAGGSVLLATVPATRDVLRRGAADVFWVQWWRWAVGVVAAGVVQVWAGVSTGERWVAVATLLALGGAALVGPVSRVARPWVVTGFLMSGWALGCANADGVPNLVRGGVVAVAALAMVAAAGRTRTSLGFAGHVAGLVGLSLGGPGWGLTATVALATGAWAVTAVAGERGHSAVATALERVDAGLRFVPWCVVTLGLPAAVGVALGAAGVLTPGDPWRVLVPSVAALAYAAVARVAGGPRVSRVLPAAHAAVVAPAAGFSAAIVGVALVSQPWPGVAALVGLVAAVLLIPGERRSPAMVWVAWFGVAPLVALLARQVWPTFRELAATTATAAVLAAVGAVLTVGATAALRDRMRGELGAARGVGVLDLGLGLVVAAVLVPQPAAGRLVLGVMVALGVLAVQTGAGVLAGAALVGAWAAVVSLTWPDLGRAPWVGVATAAGLLVAAEAAHRVVPGRGRWTRWDVPVLAAAAPVACTALVAASDGDGFAFTFAAVGVLTIAVGVRVKALPLLAELLAAAGSLLILVGAADAGPGWLALALVALAAGHTGLAVRDRGATRTARQVVGALAAVAAWVAALEWFGMSSQGAVDTTAVLSAAVLAGLAAVARVRRVDRSWHLVWGSAALAVLTTALVAAVVPASDAHATVALALAVAAAGVAFLVAAGPLVLSGLRDLAAGAGLVAVLLVLGAGGADDAARVVTLSTLGVLATAAALPVALRDRVAARPAVELGAGSALVAVLIALTVLPDAGLLVPAVAACAVQAAGAGVALRSLPLQVAAPVLACVAWLMAVADPDRSPQWYTVAVGLTLLATVAIWRRDLRRRLLDPAATGVVVVEVAGIAFLVVSSLVGAVTTSPAHAVATAAIGLGVAVWGVATRVRRRLAAGVVVVGVGVVLLVAVPLVRLLPAWGGPAGWLMLAGVGLVAVVAATLIERGRTAVRSAKGRVGALTAGWE